MSKFNSSGSCSTAGCGSRWASSQIRTGNLAYQVAAEVRRLQVQFQGDLTQQVQRRARGEVHVEDFVQAGVERGGEHARSGGLACAHFAGDQTHAVMLRQELQPRLDLIP